MIVNQPVVIGKKAEETGALQIYLSFWFPHGKSFSSCKISGLTSIVEPAAVGSETFWPRIRDNFLNTETCSVYAIFYCIVVESVFYFVHSGTGISEKYFKHKTGFESSREKKISFCFSFLNAKIYVIHRYQ